MRLLAFASVVVLGPLPAQNPQATTHGVVTSTFDPRPGETYTAVTGFVKAGVEYAITTTQKNTTLVKPPNLYIHNDTYVGPDDWKQVDTLTTPDGSTTYQFGVRGTPEDDFTGAIDIRVVTGTGLGATMPWNGGTAPFLNPHWLAVDKVTRLIGVCDPAGGKEQVWQVGNGTVPWPNPENPAPRPVYTKLHSASHSTLNNGLLSSVVHLGGSVYEIKVRDGAGIDRGFLFQGPGTPHGIATTTNSQYALVASIATSAPNDTYTLTLVEQGPGVMTALPNTTAVGPTGNAHGNSVHVVGNTAYVAYRTVGFKAFDLSTLPFVPPAIMEYDNPIVGGQPDNLVSIYPGQPSGDIYALYERSGLRVLRPALNRTSYGAGTGGTPGIPVLSATAPILGNTFTLDVTNALASTFGAVFLAAAPASIPVFGFTLLIDPSGPYASLAFFVSGSGSASLPLVLPNNLALLTLSLFNQALVVDSGAPGGIAATQGLRIH